MLLRRQPLKRHFRTSHLLECSPDYVKPASSTDSPGILLRRQPLKRHFRTSHLLECSPDYGKPASLSGYSPVSSRPASLPLKRKMPHPRPPKQTLRTSHPL